MSKARSRRLILPLSSASLLALGLNALWLFLLSAPLVGCGAAPAAPPTLGALPPDTEGRYRACVVALKQRPTDEAAFDCALDAARRLQRLPALVKLTERLKAQRGDSALLWSYLGRAQSALSADRGLATLEACAEAHPTEAPCFIAQAEHAARRGDEATALLTLARARDLAPQSVRALALDVRWQAEAGRLDRAGALLDQLSHLAPRGAGTLLGRALLALRAGRAAESLGQARLAAQLAPDSPRPFFLMARAYLDLNDRRQARGALESVLARDGAHVKARAVLGHILLSLDEGAPAAAHFTQLVAQEPEARGHQVALGQALLMTGDPTSALTWSERVLNSGEAPPEALELQFQALVALGRLDDGLALRANLYEDEGRRAHRRLMVARSLAKAGAITWAETEFTQLVEQHPEHLNGWRSYGRWHYSQRRFFKAAGTFRRALEHHPNSAILFFDLADALEEAGRREDARVMMARAASLDPSDPDYPDELARMEYLDGQVEVAIHRWTRVVERFPNQDRTRLRLSRALLSVQRFGEAAGLLTGLASRHPQDPDIHVQLGRALRGAGDSLRAADAFERALALGANVEPLLPHLAAVYADLNRTAEAIEIYEQAVARAPADGALRMEFSQVLRRRGLIEAAASQLRARLVRAPDDVHARQALAELMAQSPGLDGPPVAEEPGAAAASTDATLAALVARAPSPTQAPTAVVLRDERHVRVEGTRVASVRHVRSVLIRHRSALESNQVALIPFNVNHPPKVITARTLTPDGDQVEVPNARISTINPFANSPLFGEGRRLKLDFPAVEPGVIVDYEVVVEKPRSVELGAWWDSYVLGNADPTVRVAYSLDLPEGARFHAHAPALPAPTRAVEGGRVRLTWAASDLPQYSPRRRPSDPPIPTVHVSSLEDWAAVDRWYDDLFSPNARADEALAALTREVIGDRTDRLDQIAAVYTFVESRIKYLGLEIGVGAYQPRPASSTLARAAGDCKDMTALMVAMLSTLDIEAWPALIRPRDQGFITEDHPSPAQFSHVLLYVPDPAGDLWLDATSGMGTLRAVPEQLRGRLAFVVNGEGGLLKPVPDGDAARHVFQEELDLHLTTTGGGTLNSTITLTGDLAGKARQQLGELTPSARQTRLTSPGFVLGGALTPKRVVLEGLESPRAPVELQVSHEDLDLVGVQLDGSLQYALDLDLLDGPPLWSMTLGAQLLPPRQIKRRISITPPEGYQLGWTPLELYEEMGDVAISVTEQRGPAGTVIEVQIDVSGATFEAGGVLAIRGALHRAQAMLPGRLKISPGADFDQVAFLRTITEERPTDRRLGRMLARALIGASKYDEATGVLRRYPEGDRSVEDLTLLAAALVEAGRFQEATTIFDSIGQRPDAPPEVHLALASLLQSKAQGEMVIRALEAGLKHHPAHRELGQRLVTALSNAGDLEGALAEASRQGRLRPDDADLQRKIGDVAMALQRPEVAERAYRSAIEHGGAAPQVLNNLAWLLRNAPGRRAEAISLALRATRMRPDFDPAWDTLAELWFLEGKPQAAVEAIDRALALNPARRPRYESRRRKYLIAAQEQAQR